MQRNLDYLVIDFMEILRYFGRTKRAFAFTSALFLFLFVVQSSAQSGPCFGFPDGSACDLNFYCTIGDYCVDGECASGEPRDCSDLSDQCNSGVCDNESEACFASPLGSGSPCSDGSDRTFGDYCWNGECIAGEPVACAEFDDQCNIGEWSFELEECVIVQFQNGTACEDGYFCTVGDFCALGECVSGEARDCSAFTDQCNVGSCNELAQTCEALPVQDGTPCEGNERPGLCTIGDTCQEGTCEREVAEAGTLCRRGDELYWDCNPSEHCDGEDDRCPVDINFYHLARCQQYHLPPQFDDDDDDDSSGLHWMAWLIAGILLLFVIGAILHAYWNNYFGYRGIDEHAEADTEAGERPMGDRYSAEDEWISNMAETQKRK